MKRIAILCAGLALSGCVSASEDGKQAFIRNEKTCKSMGKTGQDLNNCMTLLFQQQAPAMEARRAQNDSARIALAGAMMGMSNSFNANAAMMSQPTYRPVTCTSRPNSSWVNGPVSSVTTNCY